MDDHSKPLKVFVGYDPREDIAWQVCRHSLLRHASGPIIVIPLKQSVLRELGIYRRPPDTTASTEFSLTRFLTPYLAADDGWSVFVDCDFLFTDDITALPAKLDDQKAIHVVQHDYQPNHQIKMDGQIQTTYPRKNWSSFMIFNGSHPDVKSLTPNVVNCETPAYLHRFEWIKNNDCIGAIDREWNFLVGEYERPEKIPCAIHYTNGGPWFDEWREVDYAKEWLDELRRVETARRDEAA